MALEEKYQDFLGEAHMSLKFQQLLYTPFYFLNGIEFKLQKINSYTKQELIEPKNNQKQNMQLQLFQL